MPRHKNEIQFPSRRAVLKSMGLAPLLLRPAPFHGYSFLFGPAPGLPNRNAGVPFSDVRLTPHYPAASPLEDVLRLVAPGSDDYVTEKYAWEIESLLAQWSQALKAGDFTVVAKALDPSMEASPLVPVNEITLRAGNGITIARRLFDGKVVPGRERFLREIRAWLGQVSERVETAEFEITGIEEIASAPPTVRLNIDIRYDIVALRNEERREERVGSWHTEWSHDESGGWKARRWEAREETLSVTHGPMFTDITSQALGQAESYTNQMLRGVRLLADSSGWCMRHRRLRQQWCGSG